MTVVEARAEPESAIRTIHTDLPVNATFHVWLKAKKDAEPGAVSFSNQNGKFAEVSSVNTEEFGFRIYQVFGGGHVELSYDTVTTAVSVIYWFTASDVLETGITVVHTKPDNAAPELPGSYHFRPPFGWMNDPNGFGRFEGRPHLFYQHYSHGLRWNTMHWGHAVSSDYLRWRHLPIFLFPSEDLTTRPDKRGGAYSGSTIPLVEGTGIRVFFTEQVQDRIPEQQIQLTATSSDLIMAGQAEVILGTRPDGQGLTPDFRDPYVFRGPDGLWKMVLGSQSDGGGVILLYETLDPTAASGWTYVGKLWVETRYKTTAIECPCLLPLDGPANARSTRWVLVYGLMHSEDPETGRKNLTMADVGWFDGKVFTKEFGQELDFGTDNYAFHAFRHRLAGKLGGRQSGDRFPHLHDAAAPDSLCKRRASDPAHRCGGKPAQPYSRPHAACRRRTRYLHQRGGGNIVRACLARHALRTGTRSSGGQAGRRFR
jgi:beta-fructofuranosidase